MRGEYPADPEAGQLFEGLSPRARGILHRGFGSGPEQGSIPACAGNTVVEAEAYGLNGVYPRVRGEYLLDHDNIIWESGLSPRARGNTVADSTDGTVDNVAVGLSPRARGILARQRWKSIPRGSIPACAGNTRAW